MKETFIKAYHRILAAEGYFSPVDGSCVIWNSTDKLVYCQMLDRNEFFVHQTEGEHFETQATIALALGMKVRQVGDVLRRFIDHGVIKAYKRRCKSGVSWVYRDILEIETWVTGDNKKIIKMDKTIPIKNKENIKPVRPKRPSIEDIEEPEWF